VSDPKILNEIRELAFTQVQNEIREQAFSQAQDLVNAVKETLDSKAGGWHFNLRYTVDSESTILFGVIFYK